MASAKICSGCGSSIAAGNHFCPSCGTKIDSTASRSSGQESMARSAGKISDKSGLTTLLLAIFLGWFGAHRFYVGKMGTALLMLVTLGGLGFWTLIDLIYIVRNEFTDDRGRVVIFSSNPSPGKKTAMTVGSVFGGLFIVAFTIVFIVFRMTSGLVDTVNGQLSALRHGDLLKAYSYTSKDFQNTTTYEQFKQFITDYPSLKYNKSASFSEREIKNNYGILKGSLTATDGAVTPVEYRFIKEDGKWKILGIIVSPTGAGVSKEYSDEKTDQSADSTITDSSSYNKNSAAMVNVYEHQKFKINYPSNWEYAEPERGTVVFRSIGSNDTNYAYISIQTVYSKKLGGKFVKLKDIVTDLKRQIPKNFSSASIIDQGEIELPSNIEYRGQYIISTYSYDNQMVKQMDIILRDPSTSFFYVWEYATPVKDYETYMPVAKKMFESWVIQ